MNCRLSPNQIQKLLNQYLVAAYEQPINGEIMKAVASRVTEKSDVLLLTAVDMEDSGPYEIAEPRVITALEAIAQQEKAELGSPNGNGVAEPQGLAITDVDGI